MSTSTLTFPSGLSELKPNIMNISQPQLDGRQVTDLGAPKGNKSINNDVIQALEIARDSPEAAGHGAIRDLLESALAGIWDRILADESRYVMSRDEFAIFNFFQDRFRNNPIAMAARRRYWDNLSVPPPSQGGA
ncbi:hypothetical protein F4824DRAFT_190092 [Ustulina deusta]|nr:hypothetical protein F4823DRAFT_237212 [Ustulina deusta]KAI3342093.1 hypothetical protein F4824DRAFT_190092 [Ustulina deusta]